MNSNSRLVRLLVNVGPFIGAILRHIPFARTPMHAIDLSHRIDELEGTGRFEEARHLRSAGLKELPASCRAPLWRSEGEDLLRSGDASQALAAFERALESAEQSAFLHGVAAPDRIYYGAAVAALEIGARDRATTYTGKFEELVKAFRNDPSLAQHIGAHEERLAWLRQKLRAA